MERTFRLGFSQDPESMRELLKLSDVELSKYQVSMLRRPRPEFAGFVERYRRPPSDDRRLNAAIARKNRQNAAARYAAAQYQLKSPIPTKMEEDDDDVQIKTEVTSNHGDADVGMGISQVSVRVKEEANDNTEPLHGTILNLKKRVSFAEMTAHKHDDGETAGTNLTQEAVEVQLQSELQKAVTEPAPERNDARKDEDQNASEAAIKMDNDHPNDQGATHVEKKINGDEAIEPCAPYSLAQMAEVVDEEIAHDKIDSVDEASSTKMD